MLAHHNQFDKRTTIKNQNRSAALGRPAKKLLSLTSQSDMNLTGVVLSYFWIISTLCRFSLHLKLYLSRFLRHRDWGRSVGDPCARELIQRSILPDV